MECKSSPDTGVLPDQGVDEACCLCHKPSQGRFMNQCDYCDKWNHGSCVNVTATNAPEIDKYKCCLCKNKPSSPEHLLFNPAMAYFNKEFNKEGCPGI